MAGGCSAQERTLYVASAGLGLLLCALSSFVGKPPAALHEGKPLLRAVPGKAGSPKAAGSAKAVPPEVTREPPRACCGRVDCSRKYGNVRLFALVASALFTALGAVFAGACTFPGAGGARGLGGLEQYFYVALSAVFYLTLVGGCWFCIPRPSDDDYARKVPRGKTFPAVLALVLALLVASVVLLVQYERGRVALLARHGGVQQQQLQQQQQLLLAERPIAAVAGARAANAAGAANAANTANTSAGAGDGDGIAASADARAAVNEPLVLAIVGMLATTMAFVLVVAVWVRSRRRRLGGLSGGRGRPLRYERRHDYAIPYTNMTPEKQQLRMVDDVWERYHTFSVGQKAAFGSPHRNPDRGARSGSFSGSFSGSESEACSETDRASEAGDGENGGGGGGGGGSHQRAPSPVPAMAAVSSAAAVPQRAWDPQPWQQGSSGLLNGNSESDEDREVEL
jgi:hypothetical protein